MNHSRCCWCNINNPAYVAYHDFEWGIPQHDDKKLFELFVLESFQAGLSWETILNKRENFRVAFDNFDPHLIQHYDNNKIELLLLNPGIIRNRIKINAMIQNARVFLKIQKEWGSFGSYIWHFTDCMTVYETGQVSSPLSKEISEDLKKRGMKFVGSIMIYSYLQAIGIVYSHDTDCFLYRTE